MEGKKKKLTQGRNTPKKLGYEFPPEWHKHEATWLTWPHNPETWPENKLKKVLAEYCTFISFIAKGEPVRINVDDQSMEDLARKALEENQVPTENIQFYHHPSNDCWCRDHGPAFLINPGHRIRKVLVNWDYNSWGGKYPPFDKDNRIPDHIAACEGIPMFKPGIVMEGGSIDVNGKGTLLTTESCLLNENRNPEIKKEEIEQYLIQFYNVEKVLWLKEGIAGDDTDGHIDDITRFVNEDTVVSVMEEHKSSANYSILKKNIEMLSGMKTADNKSLNIAELPMPSTVEENGLVLPASYANFYITNKHVLVPVFEDKNDEKALEIISAFFPDRETVGLKSRNIIWGLGSLHCLSQQEPMIAEE